LIKVVEKILKFEGKIANGNYRVSLIRWDHVVVEIGFSELEEN
jgi:hypothetical protein